MSGTKDLISTRVIRWFLKKLKPMLNNITAMLVFIQVDFDDKSIYANLFHECFVLLFVVFT